jgi:hypothetical protein
MLISQKTKPCLFVKKLIAFFLLANLIVLPLAASFSHICFKNTDVTFQHNMHSHQHDESDEAFSKVFEFENHLCYACIYLATLSVISPIDTNLDNSHTIDTLNPLTEQIFASSFQSLKSGRDPPSVKA